MPDPITTVAVINLVAQWGGKLLDRVLRDNGRGAALDTSGRMHALQYHPGGALTVPDLPRLAPRWAQLRTTRFSVHFVPGDEESGEYLLGDQPVLLLVEDDDAASDLAALAFVTTLDDPVPAELHAGNYTVLAIVYLDDDFDMIDGVGYAEFSIAPGESEFALLVPVFEDADGSIADAIDDAMAGEAYAPAAPPARIQAPPRRGTPPGGSHVFGPNGVCTRCGRSAVAVQAYGRPCID